MGHALRVGMRELNSFPGEEARLALGEVESSMLKRLPGQNPCASRSRREFSQIGVNRHKGQLGESRLAVGRTRRVKWLMVC